MSGDDYRWDQMSVMERCEVLRAQMRRLDETIAASFTVEPGWSVSEGELARLRRIEEAAREVDSWDPILCGVNEIDMLKDLRALSKALGAALDSEPKR